MSECAVYRMYDDAGDLLYVGMSINVPQRLAGHKSKQWWPSVRRVEVKHFRGRKAAAAEEARAIREESPRYNVDPGRCVGADTVAELRGARPGRKPLNRYGLLRYERGLSIEAVVQGSGVGRMTLIRFEAGEGRPSAPTAKALADFYEISVPELLGIETEAA